MERLALKALRNITLAVLYIFGVSQIVANGDEIFGSVDNMFAPFVFLMLFSLSASVVGGLVFGPAIYLFFEGKKKESAKAAFYSIGWLGLFTVIGLVVLIFV